ncbi:MAG: nitroreductase family protein [Acidobacteria bacterium]|nr:nitroreductase family protein [Acidobacteriota bacterium]
MAVTQETTELANLVKTRRSIRVWQDKAVPEELLSQAIELATWTANPGNQQNWRFYVVINKNTINALADAVESIAAELNSWPEIQKITPPRPASAPPPRKPGFFRAAPAIIVVGSNNIQTPQDKALEERGKYDPRATLIREWRNSANARLQTIGGLLALLCLALHKAGLGAVWMTGPIQAKGEIEKILNMPAGMDACLLMPVGYPAESPETRGRKAVAEICEFVR